MNKFIILWSLWMASNVVIASNSLFFESEKASTSKPNIVFVLTDDQDTELFGQHPMNKTKKLLADEGMLFTNMFVTSPLCCPSRSSILSGQYVHNHHALNNSINGGCSSKSWQKDTEPHSFVTYLKSEGYKTFFAGKYLNTYGFKNVGGVKHIPPGWDDWHGLVGNSRYYNYSLSVNGIEEKHGDNYTEDYLPDVIHRRGIDFLGKQSASQPFFMMLSTPSCHGPFTPAPQYEKEYSYEVAPRTKHYNIHGKDKHWLIEQAITPMPDDVVKSVDEIYRDRHRTLLSVDDMIEDVYNKLKDMGLLENTYIFFSSDNGFHLGQFSLPMDKRQLYEFDIRVPLIVRGPGIKAKSTNDESVTNIDLAPTFVELAGSTANTSFDGQSFLSILHGQTHSFRSTVLVEHYGERQENIPQCPQWKDQWMANCISVHHCVCEDSWNNTYGCIRYENSKESFKFCEFQDDDNFIEVYDLKGDPFELDNIAKTAPPEILDKLTDKLASLSTCKGKSCHDNSDL